MTGPWHWHTWKITKEEKLPTQLEETLSMLEASGLGVTKGKLNLYPESVRRKLKLYKQCTGCGTETVEVVKID